MHHYGVLFRLRKTNSGVKQTSSQPRGFTLIELLVVIAIVGILASIVLASVNAARSKGRDASRKAQLKSIATALELYYNNNGHYPITCGGSCASITPTQGGVTWCSCGGGASTWISPLVTDKDISSSPVDPNNFDQGPWCSDGNSTHNTIYTYESDGTHYILCAWLENTSDPSTLQYQDVPDPWNTSLNLMANFNYSKYNFVIAQ